MQSFKLIKLSKGKIAIVDTEDYMRLSEYKWYFGSRYACRMIYKERKLLLLHYAIVEKKEGLYIDHINGNTLDNRKSNLRYVTHQQNCFNTKTRKDNKLGIRGVYKYKHKFRAQICKDGKTMDLGLFSTLEEASLEYKKMARKLFGDYIRV